MGKIYSLISALLLTVSATFAAAPDSYEWWFDHDVSSAQAGTVIDGKVNLQIDTSDLPKGIHYFNLRLAERDSVYGPVYRKLFHAFGPDNGAISYEYWFDSDYASKETGSLDRESNLLDLDISSLPQGVHFFNCRLGYGDGNWGPVYRNMFLNIQNSENGSVNAVAYEYWIDNNYSEKTEGALAPGVNSYAVDLTGVHRGLHRFSYRLMTGEGIWGAPFTSYFYSESNAARFTQYEYWLDNDYANHVTGNATGNPTSFEVDLSGFDKSGGAHYFHLRTRDGDGDWSPVYRKLLVFNKTEKRQPVIGYRHYLDGTALGYVEVERQFVDSYMFDVNLPDSLYPCVRNRRPSFDGDRVFLAGADSIDYTMQVRTEFGWAAPQKWRLGIGNDFSTTAVAMEINSKHTFAAPTALGFAAMKFTAPGDSLYFRSDIPVALDIYKDGERVAALTPAQVKGMAMLRLAVGDYFGVLCGVEDAEAKEFTLHLMDTPNQVPMPHITYENEMVDISCTRKDAQIRYTLDGKDPDEESTLYSEPFMLDRNAVIKAMAYVPNSDINSSEIASFVVDSYRVATPTGSFDTATRLLTISCATDGASISYTFDREGEWTEYTSPVSITRNRTVYAKAMLDGWNDSDVAEIRITELADNVPAPEISFEDGTVTITCANADAEIHYTIDDPELTAESPLYTGPFDLDRNATVRAFALIPGLDIEPSDVVTYVVDSYKVSTPTGSFDSATRLLTISCATDGASISYTFDREGEWTEYTSPVSITRNRTVYAKAMLEGWNDSDVAEIRITELADNVPSPEISFADGTVAITCVNADAEIHYTIDDPELTAESPLYTGPFDLDRNATVRAFALIPGLDIEPSDMVTYVVDSYKVSTPTGSFDSATRLLTISCAIDGASISYSFDREGPWIPYSSPIEIDGNRTIYAIATYPDFNDSDIAEIVISDMKCADVRIRYNGRYVSLESEEPDASIRYTTDGNEPSVGMEYTGEFDAEGICTIRAVAVKSGYLNSNDAQFVVEYYADEEHAETTAEGLLASAFEWDETDLHNSIESFKVEGRLNEADYEFIRSMAALRHLDIENVTNAHIPGNAFRYSRLISISLPADIVECGDSILSEISNLSSVIWNSRTMNVEEGITQGLVNPNVILFVPDEVSVASPGNINIVKAEKASSVTLHYGFPYYAAREFRADHVSLTHEFLQTTKPDTCRGWETIVLPFSPTGITHAVNGPVVPFAAWNGDLNGDKPFWLYSAVSSGWEPATSIEACVPYIISMPNNADYVETFNLGGKVTFSAENVDLGPESSLASADSWVEGTQFEGTFMPVEEDGLLSLNVNATEESELQPGSAFVTDAVTVPFGAYVRGAGGRRAMPVFGESSSVDMPMLIDSGLMIETPAPGVLKVSSGRERRVSVTTATGVTIRTLHLKPGETVTLEGLTRDMYIVAGRKVMVR